MRTTLQIDEDVHRAAKSIAAAERKTVGEVISTVNRKALAPQNYLDDADDIPSFRISENAEQAVELLPHVLSIRGRSPVLP